MSALITSRLISLITPGAFDAIGSHRHLLMRTDLPIAAIA